MFSLDVPRGGLATLQSSMVARDLVASHCLPSQHQHHPSPLAPSMAMPHPLATQPTFTGPKSALLRPWRALEVHLDLQALPGPFLGLKSSSQLSAPALLDPRTSPPKGEAPRPPGCALVVSLPPRGRKFSLFKLRHRTLNCLLLVPQLASLPTPRPLPTKPRPWVPLVVLRRPRMLLLPPLMRKWRKKTTFRLLFSLAMQSLLLP